LAGLGVATLGVVVLGLGLMFSIFDRGVIAHLKDGLLRIIGGSQSSAALASRHRSHHDLSPVLVGNGVDGLDEAVDPPYLVPTRLYEAQSIGPIPVRTFYVAPGGSVDWRSSLHSAGASWATSVCGSSCCRSSRRRSSRCRACIHGPSTAPCDCCVPSAEGDA